MNTPDISGFVWDDSDASCAHAYLYTPLRKILERVDCPPSQKRLLDLGCGNGSLTARLHSLGWSVVGVDPSEQGIAQARTAHPTLDFRRMSAYDDLRAQLGSFPVVVSLEVIEHLYAPRDYVRRVHDVLYDDGLLILSTPYHGYWKNLALALSGRLDDHFTALWDHGHIKFWSAKTITALLEEGGFRVGRVTRIGRVPALARSMLVTAYKQS